MANMSNEMPRNLRAFAQLSLAIVAMLTLCRTLPSTASSSLPSPKAKWREAAETKGAWWQHGDVTEQSSIGQQCDTGNAVSMASSSPGCVAIWISDKTDAFTIKDLPPNEQNNFLNTVHYRKALKDSSDQMGMRAGSLPIPGKDFDPVCYVAELHGKIVLGFEEPEGDNILPCPGAREGLNFTEEQIVGATDEELQVMCEACFQSVCSGRGSRDATRCGGSAEGGVEVGDGENDAHVEFQVSSSYHCHLTMAEGACSPLYFDQHVTNDGYGMDSGVLCGWDSVKQLDITHCDCSVLVDGDIKNRCGSDECLNMAIAGVVCGNCWQGVGCSHKRTYEGIFGKPGMPDPYEGSPHHRSPLCLEL